MKSRQIKYILLLAALFLVFCFCRSCCNVLFVSYRESYTSPQGTNTIIVEYDHVCRPYVYKHYSAHLKLYSLFSKEFA